MTSPNDRWANYLEALDELGSAWVEETPQTLFELVPDTTVEQWKEFLRLPAIKQRREEVLSFLVESKTAELIANMSNPAAGVNKAQLLTALMSYDKKSSKVSDTITIFCHVPLSPEEAMAPSAGMYGGRVLRNKGHNIDLEAALDVGQRE